MREVKCWLFGVCEVLGLFQISRLVYRRRLRILCYHGFQLHDECAFRPKLFVSNATFRRRLGYVRKMGFHVLPLEEALVRLREGTLPKNAVAITIDDGFHSTFSVAAPVLREFACAATVYVTTYYVEKQVPVFRLAVQYVFWKIGVDKDKLTKIAEELPGLATTDDAHAIQWRLIEYGETMGSEEERQALLIRLAKIAEVDLVAVSAMQMLSLMSPEEVRALAEDGVDIQLHTHRHRFPLQDERAASEEVLENRRRLEKLTRRRATHFCYPSGVFAEHQWPWLERLGVTSATTCLPGLNSKNTPALALTRFLDSEDVRFVEFRAELSGFSELLRSIRRSLKSIM